MVVNFGQFLNALVQEESSPSFYLKLLQIRENLQLGQSIPEESPRPLKGNGFDSIFYAVCIGHLYSDEGNVP